jgi:hypothetical protein
MTIGTNNTRARNLVLIALLGLITVFTAFHEGYFPKISTLFLVSLIAGYLISVWLAMSISSKRLLSLILGIFIIEYIKETIGIRSGVWTYHGIGGSYNFGVWAWVLAGVITYTLSTRIVIRQIRKLKISWPGWLKPVIIIVVASLIPLTLGDYRNGAGWLFWLLYAVLFIAGLYASFKMDFPVFAGIIITSWLVGNPSEYVGSAASGVWTFTHNPNYPPFFLLFGCWPLEILAQYLLSAYIAKEPLDKDTF